MTDAPVVIAGDAATLLEAAGKAGWPAGTRVFVVPVDAEAYSAAIDNGAIRTLHRAGAVICAPGCGPQSPATP